MVTKQTEPDPSSWIDQERRQRRSVRNRKIGALAVVAALVAAATIAAIVLPWKDRANVGTQPPPSGPYVIDLTTGAATPLPDNLPEASLYDLSQDGTMIAGAPCCDPPNLVWVAKIDGTGIRQIIIERFQVDGFAPRWSPDGSMLVFQERNASTQEIGNIVVVDVVTRRRTTITDLPNRSYSGWSLLPSFSADGGSVFFRMPNGPSGDVRSRGVGPRVRSDHRGRDHGTGTRCELGRVLARRRVPRVRGAGDLDDLPRGRGRWEPTDAPRCGRRIDRIGFSPTGSQVAYSDPNGVHIVDVETGADSLFTNGEPVDWSW